MNTFHANQKHPYFGCTKQAAHCATASMANSDGELGDAISHSKIDEGVLDMLDEAAAQGTSPVDHADVDNEDSGDDEPSGESLQGEVAGDEEDDSDSAGSILEFIVGDNELEDNEEAAVDDDDAPIEVDAELLRKKMKRRRKRFNSEIKAEAEELLATGGKKHKVRVGSEAFDGDGKASRSAHHMSQSPSESDGDGEAVRESKKKTTKTEKGLRSIDLKYKEEEDDENQADYNAAFIPDADEADAFDEAKPAAPRVVDPMEQLESYQTPEDKAAVEVDVPERIFENLPPGKLTLNDMAEWQKTLAPRIVAFELKKVAYGLLSGTSRGNQHLGFEHIVKENADPEAVFDATIAVATHIGVYLREPPFIRQYLSSCYSSALHHEALWYIFDRVMDATLLVKNAADCIKLIEDFLNKDDPLVLEAETLFKSAPEVLSETVVFDFRHYVHVTKYTEALSVDAVSSLSASDSNFHCGVQKQEVHAFLASFTLPAHSILPCMAGDQDPVVKTPDGRFLDLLEPLVNLLGKNTSEQAERVVIATASKIIAANIRFRQYIRDALSQHVYMTIKGRTLQESSAGTEDFCWRARRLPRLV
jgi:hypothetical protein